MAGPSALVDRGQFITEYRIVLRKTLMTRSPVTRFLPTATRTEASLMLSIPSKPFQRAASGPRRSAGEGMKPLPTRHYPTAGGVGASSDTKPHVL
jgi:hypothetical protein